MKYKLFVEEPKDIEDIFEAILRSLQKIDFLGAKYPDATPETRAKLKVDNDDRCTIICDELIKQAQKVDWNFARVQEQNYVYNGCYWKRIEDGAIKNFASKCAIALGVNHVAARNQKFVESLYKQFCVSAFFKEVRYNAERVAINLKNGTFLISENQSTLVPFSEKDFLTYQLPFDYDSDAKCPKFDKFLAEVQPEQKARDVLAEYIGYCFLRGNQLKLEKCLVLNGGGSNGKSVFYDVITALFGVENTSSISLHQLTDDSGYYRAFLVGKLVNYSSEIDKLMNSDMFKQMVSGEPITARNPYGKVFELTNYAKLIFNSNTLPNAENTTAYFRRLLVVPFRVEIPKAQRNKRLAQQIIKSGELSGIFNWALAGLKRVLQNEEFSDSAEVDSAIQEYKVENDNVLSFCEYENFVKDDSEKILFRTVFGKYKEYCHENNLKPCSSKTFSKRLKLAGFEDIKNSDIYIFGKFSDAVPAPNLPF